ncbi:poly(A)-binding protein-interacting protein [Encephalitozoon romaleae SJ-2008]|uniref:Poly(A)-binding protein-interacting protein n=1 Tax=Encephalitozoon romaleae (strain SJ-2008) TaxID=1178016 RepID=I6ZWC8_ENCRO|nr:poly(A)-binding protein-interacting protein [Encephalitozoon romaleae SJ-2008]AFN84071.1 poly(A)-binding protein-interacting protein [Encephalitozoon romaleae SJ-2008]
MDNYVISICFKNNPSKMIGTFLSNEDGMVKLEDAFFENNPGIVFPTISISESDIITVKKADARPEEEKERIPLEASEKTESGMKDSEQGLFKTDSEISEVPEEMRTKTVLVETKDITILPEEESKDWNQFEANSKLFNIDNKFDEEEYMDVLDKSSNWYKSKLLMARRIEKEIMSSTTTDPHRLEERGLGRTPENEDMYSTVIGKDHISVANKTPSSVEKQSKDASGIIEAKRGGDDGEKRKMIIEIEGLSLSETKDGGSLANTESSKNEESSNTQEERKNTRPKKSVRYGWMHTKFDSSKNLLGMIKSRFKGAFDISGSDLKWGGGLTWEIAAKNIIKKAKGGKASSIRRVPKKSPGSK